MTARHGSAVLAALLAAGALLSSRPLRADESPLARLEAELRASVAHAQRSVVVVVPRDVSDEKTGWSSGVLVSRDGLLLSDGDAGMVLAEEGSKERVRRDDVAVRVADPAGGWTTYRGTVLRRDLAADCSIVKIESPPEEGFVPLRVGTSAGLRRGDFGFAVGCALDPAGEVRPTVTGGTVATLVADEGAARWIWATTAVNPGTNGGAFLDRRGTLVGTISTYGDPEDPDEPHQFLGKIVPIDRVRAALASVPEAAAALDPGGDEPVAGGDAAAALERTVRRAAERAAPWVVSVEVVRRSAIAADAPVGDEVLAPPRYRGPVSGVAISADGWVITSLYNLANLATLVDPLWRAPAPARVAAGLDAIESTTVHWPGGPSVRARRVAHDPRTGVVLLKADLPRALPEGFSVRLFEPAPGDAYQPGRFVVAVGNPYGKDAEAAPLVTTGILSKRHPDDAAAAWRGSWQTDAPTTDANVGGAAVDLEGRFLGLLTLWDPAQHGRNSGIAFVVPWGRIQRDLPDLEAGRVPRPGLLGVRFAPGALPRIADVVPASPAARAGLAAGDLLEAIDRERVATAGEAVQVLGYRREGERVRLRVRRAGRSFDVVATLSAQR